MPAVELVAWSTTL